MYFLSRNTSPNAKVQKIYGNKNENLNFPTFKIDRNDLTVNDMNKGQKSIDIHWFG